MNIVLLIYKPVFNVEQAQCSIMMVILDIGTHTNYQFSRWQGPLSLCL